MKPITIKGKVYHFADDEKDDVIYDFADSIMKMQKKESALKPMTSGGKTYMFPEGTTPEMAEAFTREAAPMSHPSAEEYDPSALPMRSTKTDAGYKSIPASFSQQEEDRYKSKVSGLVQQAKDTSPMAATNIAASKTIDQLWTGVKNLLPDSIGGDPAENLRKHEEGFEAFSHLEDRYPARTTLGKVAPYLLPVGNVPGGAIKAASAIPAVTKAYQKVRNVAPGGFGMAETLPQFPKALQAAYGGAVGGIDPYDTVLAGAAGGFLGAHAGEKLLSRFVKPDDFTTKMQGDVIDWAEKSGFKPHAGTAFQNRTLTGEAQAATLYKGSIDVFQRTVREHDSNATRVLLHNVFGVKGKEFNNKTINSVVDKASKGMESAVQPLRGNGVSFIKAIDDIDDVVVGGTVEAVTDQANFNVYDKLGTQLREIVGSGYITGPKYQKMDQALRSALKQSDPGTPFANRIKDLQKSLDDSVDEITPGLLVDYKKAKEKYAAAMKVKEHTVLGKLNYKSLRNDLQKFNPGEFGVNLPPEGTPMGELQRLALFDELTKGNGASLSISDEFGKALKERPLIEGAKLEMGLRGLTPQSRKNPFDFRSNIHLGGRAGSSISEQNSIMPDEGPRGLLDSFGENITQPLLDRFMEDYKP